MHVAELDYPGTWLDYDDKGWAWEINKVIGSLESCLTEAGVSLNLFELALQGLSAFNAPEMSEWVTKRRETLLAEIEQRLGQANFYGNYFGITQQVSKTINREKWTTGELPRAYKHKLPFMYARSFIHALDISGKLLTVLSETKDAPEEVRTQSANFYSRFPELKGVRDTIEHIEDRIRGLARNNQPLGPEGGGLWLSNLRDNRFGCTMSDGHYGEVEISAKSLSLLGECIQKVINSFRWKGHRTHYPQ